MVAARAPGPEQAEDPQVIRLPYLGCPAVADD
jgi:hypothetical protein